MHLDDREYSVEEYQLNILVSFSLMNLIDWEMWLMN